MGQLNDYVGAIIDYTVKVKWQYQGSPISILGQVITLAVKWLNKAVKRLQWRSQGTMLRH